MTEIQALDVRKLKYILLNAFQKVTFKANEIKMAYVYVYGQERCWKQNTNIRIYTDPFSSFLIYIILNCFCFLKTCICFYTNQYAACQREFLINCLGIYGFIPIQCASLSALMLYSLIKAYILLEIWLYRGRLH